MEESQNNPEDILHAMATGEDPAAIDDPAGALDSVLEGSADHLDDEPLKNGAGEDPFGELTAGAAFGEPDPKAHAVNRARAKNLQKAQASSSSTGFQQIAAPMGLVMAMVLIGIGITSLVLAADPMEEKSNSMLFQHGSLLGGTSIAFGVVLIGTSFFLFYQMAQAKKQQKRAMQ